MIKNSIQRLLLFVVAALMAPFAFVWAKGDYYTSDGIDAISDSISYFLHDPITTASILAYIFAVLALLVKRNNNLRSSLIVLSFLTAIDSIVKFAYLLFVENKYDLITSLKYLFYRSEPLFPWQLLNTIGIAILTYLMQKEVSWLKNQILIIFSKLKNASSALKDFGNRALALERASIVAFLIIVIFTFNSTQTKWEQFKQAQSAFSSGFHPELIYVASALAIGVLIAFFASSTVVGFFFSTFYSWRQEITDLNNNLADFKLSRYVTRSISGYLYWSYSMAIVIILSLVAPMQTVLIYDETRNNLGSGFHFELLLLIFAVPTICIAVGYIVVLLIRIVFEVLIATIHIAQNTSQRTHLNKP